MSEPEVKPEAPSQTEQAPVQEPKFDLRREIFEYVKTMVWIIALFLALRTFVVEGFEIQGSSMNPTLEQGQRLLVNKFSHYFHKIEHGEIIVFRYPEDTSRRFVKRVIGIPGDEVEIHRGQVYVNGEKQLQDYIPKSSQGNSEMASQRVPPGQYFVLGDHRTVSSDSRVFGMVPEELIIGKVTVRFWPVEKLHIF